MPTTNPLARPDTIRTLAGTYGEVTSMRVVARQQEMYNLTVDEARTFFVGGVNG